MTRLPYWAWRPWLTPWHAALAWWHRDRPARIPPLKEDTLDERLTTVWAAVHGPLNEWQQWARQTTSRKGPP